MRRPQTSGLYRLQASSALPFTSLLSGVVPGPSRMRLGLRPAAGRRQDLEKSYMGFKLSHLGMWQQAGTKRKAGKPISALWEDGTRWGDWQQFPCHGSPGVGRE